MSYVEGAVFNSDCVPELLDLSNKLLFGCWFDLLLQNLLELVPEVFNIMAAFMGSLPPVDVVFLEELEVCFVVPHEAVVAEREGVFLHQHPSLHRIYTHQSVPKPKRALSEEIWV